MLPLRARRLRGLQELSDEVVHGIFGGGTGPSAGGAQAQVPGPNGRSDTRRHRTSTPPMPRYRMRIPGPRYGYGPSLLPSTEVYAVLRDNGFSPLGIPQAPRLRLHDRGDRPRRRGRPAGYRRAQRPDHPLPAGLPDGRAITTSELDGSFTVRRAAAARRTMSGPRRSRHGRPHVASRTVPMPKANPLAAKPAAADRSSRRPRLRRSRHEVSRAAAGRDDRLGSGQARPADCADPGHADGAGAGVTCYDVADFAGRQTKKRPGLAGAFFIAATRLFARPAAARIRSATSSGCETSDRWPASSSIVVAFIRLARNRSRSGLMVWSSFDTAYQLGLLRHAAPWCGRRKWKPRSATARHRGLSRSSDRRHWQNISGRRPRTIW